MADTPFGETVTPGSLSNDGQGSTPITGNVDNAEVERLKREAEQAKIRANQLANQLEERRKADEAARQKQLEEREEFRTLYEQTNARLETLQETQAAQEKRTRLSQATDEMLHGYPANVAELARTTGLTLSDETEEARSDLKRRLDTIKEKIPGGTTQNVTPNNPSNPAPAGRTRADLTRRNENGYSPMAIAAARGDKSLQYEYIRQLPAIQRMREISKGA